LGDIFPKQHGGNLHTQLNIYVVPLVSWLYEGHVLHLLSDTPLLCEYPRMGNLHLLAPSLDRVVAADESPQYFCYFDSFSTVHFS
jgi:hypothetical protein